MDIDTLKTELLAGHPVTGAYDPTDALAAAELNVVNRTTNKESLTGSEVMQAIVAADFAALTDADKQTVWGVLHLGTINPFGVEATLLTSAFGAGSATIATLGVLRKNNVSRGVELGFGFVGHADVEDARRL